MSIYKFTWSDLMASYPFHSHKPGLYQPQSLFPFLHGGCPSYKFRKMHVGPNNPNDVFFSNVDKLPGLGVTSHRDVLINTCASRMVSGASVNIHPSTQKQQGLTPEPPRQPSSNCQFLVEQCRGWQGQSQTTYLGQFDKVRHNAPAINVGD